MKIEVCISCWKVEDEAGREPLEKGYTQALLHLPDVVEIEAEDDEEAIATQLYSKFGFFPESMTWEEVK